MNRVPKQVTMTDMRVGQLIFFLRFLNYAF